MCIPTYNRAGLLKERFAQVERILRASPFRDEVEVIVSNNASADHTEEVMRSGVAAIEPLCPIRSYTQPENIGGEANFKFLYDHARGTYVWLFSDDDVLYEAEFDRLIADLKRYQPEVCVSSFDQPPWNSTNRVFMCSGDETELITDLVAAVPYLVRFPEITMYVYRRHVLTASERAAMDRACEDTYYWFVALSAMLLAQHQTRLLLRSANIAGCGPDHIYIQYSPGAWETVERAALIGVGDHPARTKLEEVLPSPPEGVYVVGHLLRYCLGFGIIRHEIAERDFRYVRDNPRTVWFSTWRNTIKVPLVLALFPVMSRILSRRGRRKP